MFEKGKKENISFYQWDIQELITQKLRMQQSYESFNSYLYSQLIKKLETIFVILLSYIMVNDNFKLILTTSKEKENFWKQIFELIQIQPYHKIQKYQFDNSEFSFFHYFYEVITEDYHQENKDILKDIVDEPIENWSKKISKRKNISEKYLKNFLNDLIGISFNESEKQFFKDYIQDFQKFILHFEESQINSLTKFSLREIYQKIDWEIFQKIYSIYKLVNEFNQNQNQNQNRNQFGEFSLNRFFDSQFEIIKNSLNKNNSPNELIPIGTCIDKIYDFLNQLTNYTNFKQYISELFKKWSNIYFLFQTKTKNLSKISQTQEFKKDYQKNKVKGVSEIVFEQFFQEYDIFASKRISSFKKEFEEKFLQVFRQNEILDERGFLYGFCLEYLKGEIQENEKQLVLTRITSSFTENQNLNEKQKSNKKKLLAIFLAKFLDFLTNEKLYENIFGISDYEEPNQMFSLRDTKFIIPTKIAKRIIHFH
ncbi:hypothetical protein M0811_11322 [Anaeramoeba ignava]|uniref:Uncharacterized protein n=1 Tax=Anaeramoeba ignava TaxID=1746090 RepID=A0A9Q0LC21_ANAIG|nr:hypothetical protein M0811_11322 [Anaeramoeba ignava]